MQRAKLNEEYAPFNRSVHSPEDLVSIARSICIDSAVEIFCVFLLDVKNRVIGYTQIGMGGPDACPVDVRSVFRAAVMIGASSIVCTHNHPSGDASESRDDINLTTRIKQAGALLDIKLLDHVIVSTNSHNSLVAKGLL